MLALVPDDTAAVRAALLADRQALVLDVDTDLADLRLRLAPWRGLAKTSYLLDFHGPLVDAHRTHTAALVLCAKTVTAIEIAARGAQRSLRHSLEAGVELVDALLRGWQAAQRPPDEEAREFLTMAARGADLLAFVAVPQPEVGRAARLTAQGLRWLASTLPDPPDVDLPSGVATQQGRLVGARAEQTATGLAAGVTDVVAALDEVLGDVGAASRAHEAVVDRATLAPREPDAPTAGPLPLPGPVGVSGGTLVVVPDVVARLRRVLVDGADDLEVTGPPEPAGLGDTEAARDLAHHTALARDVVVARLETGRTGLRRCSEGVAGLESRVRDADDRLAARLAALARGLA